MIPVVAFVGKPDAGKTFLIEKLIAEFKSRGLRVAAVKHAHQAIETDTPGKDTWRFTRAGSNASAVVSPSGITIFRQPDREPDLGDAVTALGEGYDIVLAEGFKQSKFPRIEIMSSGQPDTLCNEKELCAIVSDERTIHKVPVFGRSDIQQLADFIEKEIVDKIPPGMDISVNGKLLFMKPFVKDIIGSSILAMIASLKSVGIIRSVIIRIRSKP